MKLSACLKAFPTSAPVFASGKHPRIGAALSGETPVVAVIGAGFSGLMTCWNLVRNHPGSLKLVLLDPSPGRGPAYEPLSPIYVLNVPAGNMGALADQPGHFFSWLENRFPGRYQPQDFVPRQLYGDYLEELLVQTREQAARGPVSLEEKRARVRRIDPRGGRIRLELDSGESLLADRVVLALGNQAPAHPQLENISAAELEALPGYIQNPWRSDCLSGLDPEQPVLLLGSGLTMVDLVLGLRHRGFQGPIEAISHHARLPEPHRAKAAWPDFVAEGPAPTELSGWLRLVRNQLDLAAEAGVDWRAVIDALRPHTSAIWQGLSLEQRRRFMRHLRHRWTVARHRLPAEVDARLQTWIEDGSLRLHAGRIQGLSRSADGLQVSWLPRGGSVSESMQVQRLINCTGPDSNYHRLQDPLIAGLREQGLLQPDPLSLGLQASETGALLDSRGRPSHWLFSLGATLRGRYWESVAVPELRIQAAELARQLSDSLASDSRALAGNYPSLQALVS
ncbi:MAG: FAD/NAD(P)-binding protein [Candidatus Sericytochromatia bacterium]